jgi:hypothetical protein
LEPSHGECERVSGRAIEPLDVVDRDQHRLARRERPQAVEQAETDRMRLGRDGRRLCPQQCHFQRQALGRRQAIERSQIDPVEEIDQRCERQLGLGATRPRHQHAQTSLARDCDPGLPQRGLADSRFANEHK